MALFLAAIVSATAVLAEDVLYCGSAPYYPSEYTCYSDTTLCPNLYGDPTLPCSTACYSPHMYACEDGETLTLLPEAAPGSRFKLEAHSTNELIDGRLAKVCGREFSVGDDAETCIYCFNAPPMYVCENYENETVLVAAGNMDVDVPGSQYWYVHPDTGRLRTTAAGKAMGSDRQWAGLAVTVYEGGFFWHDDASYWLACPASDGSASWEIFAPIGTAAGRTDCEKIKLTTVDATGQYEGAYSYN